MILEIENHLPGILRWFEVIDRQTDEIPPVKYACETMQSVELELRQLVTTYTVEPKRNLNPFTMRLQGIIDANVQGGISKYQQAFFTQEFAKLCPEHMPHVYTLKNLILEAMQVRKSGCTEWFNSVLFYLYDSIMLCLCHFIKFRSTGVGLLVMHVV